MTALGPWAATLYLALAAIGLDIALGIGGLASLSQGAFVGIGAFSSALLLKHTGLDPASAAITGALAAALAGALVGSGAVRLRAAFVVVVTWVFAWALFLSLSAFPSISGGAQGIVIEDNRIPVDALARELRLDRTAHFFIALGLLVIALLVHRRLRLSSSGLAARAIAVDPSAADALGIDRSSLQLRLFVISAAIGGLAGGWAVQLAGVADPSAYGPALSVSLFVIALLGFGRGSFVLTAALILGAIPLGVRAGFGGGGLSERFEPAAIAAAMVVALVLSRSEFVTLARRRRGTNRRSFDITDGAKHPLGPLSGASSLRVAGVVKRFGGVVALDGLSLDLKPGEVHALIGPNGSGKTTLLRVISGTSAPEKGQVLLDEENVTRLPVPDRVRKGIVRCLQRSSVFSDLTVGENVEVAMETARKRSGFPELLATPRARAEEIEIRGRVARFLADAELSTSAGSPAQQLSVYEQRLLAIVSAQATGARFLLLDEPAAGVTAVELPGLSERLRTLKERGWAILVVDHNMRFVRTIADRVTVMAAGRVVASGSFAEVVDDDDVREVYPGLAGV